MDLAAKKFLTPSLFCSRYLFLDSSSLNLKFPLELQTAEGGFILSGSIKRLHALSFLPSYRFKCDGFFIHFSASGALYATMRVKIVTQNYYNINAIRSNSRQTHLSYVPRRFCLFHCKFLIYFQADHQTE